MNAPRLEDGRSNDESALTTRHSVAKKKRTLDFVASVSLWLHTLSTHSLFDRGMAFTTSLLSVVHIVDSSNLLLRLPASADGSSSGGFGRLTMDRMGGDALARRMMQHFATLSQVLVNVPPAVDPLTGTPPAAVDDAGYLHLFVDLTKLFPALVKDTSALALLVRQLYRKSVLLGHSLGMPAMAKVTKMTPGGGVVMKLLESGLTAVALTTEGVEPPPEEGATVPVRLLAYDTKADISTVTLNPSTIARSPRSVEEVAACAMHFPVDTIIACKVLSVGTVDSWDEAAGHKPLSKKMSLLVCESPSISLAVDASLQEEDTVKETLPLRTASVVVFVPVLSSELEGNTDLETVGHTMQIRVVFTPCREWTSHTPFLVGCRIADGEPTTPVWMPPARWALRERVIRAIAAGERIEGAMDVPFPWKVRRPRTLADIRSEINAHSESSRLTSDKGPSRRELETEIDKFERSNGKIAPRSPEEFEKLLVSAPNASYVWTQYMAFHLQAHETEKARLVAEKALRTIGVRENKELLNIWVAYMNAENMQGTPESLTAVFKRALQHNEQQRMVHEKLTDIFAASKKLPQWVSACRVLVSKFPTYRVGWEKLAVALVESERRDQLKRMLKDASCAISKDDYCRLVVHIAVHDYQSPQGADRARSELESLLVSNPRRSDVWGVYLDHEVKLLQKKVRGDSSDQVERGASSAPPLGLSTAAVSAVRTLFERVVAIPFPPKVVQGFMTKFLQFEQTFGSAATVEHVKQLARAYVEAKVANAVGVPVTETAAYSTAAPVNPDHGSIAPPTAQPHPAVAPTPSVGQKRSRPAA